jgi:glycosyltransferase involved in cell wall biosynthesis
MIPCLLKGGTEIQTLHLISALVASEYQVTTLCYFEYDTVIVEQFKNAGSKVKLLQWNRAISAWQFIFRLRRILKNSNQNLVHVQYMAPGALPIIAVRLAGIKKVLATVHQPYTKNHGFLAKYILRISALLCARFIAVSKNVEISWFGSGQLYNETMPLKKQAKHFTIYNAVDVEQIRDIKNSTDIISKKEKLGIPTKAIIFGVVSRLRHEKGIDVMVDAFYQLQKENKNTHLLVVGTGPDEKLLKEMVSQYKINDKVTFFGEANWVTAMQQMALMDVVVVPSRFEGFGLTAAEAMAMGKPVVASNVFGLKEVVTNKKTGQLFESENRNDLYLKLKTICENKSDYNNFMDSSLKEAYRFGLPIYFKKVITLYNLI